MPWNAQHTTFTVYDGGSLSQSLGPGTGTITIPGLSANDSADVIDVRDRMTHYATITGPERTFEFSAELVMTAGALNTQLVLNAIRKAGAWASAVSIETLTDTYCLKLVAQLSDSSGRTITVTLPKCRMNADLVVDDQYAKLAITGTCYLQPTFA